MYAPGAGGKGISLAPGFTPAIWQGRAAAAGSCEITFLDPVPFQDDPNSQTLMNGNAITTNYTALASQGRSVWGISADNAARVVLRFRANDAKELLTVTLSDTDNGYASATFANLGGLYSIGGNENDAQGQRQLDQVVPYADSDGTLWGFAVYRAPPDFARVDGQGSALTIDMVNNTTRAVQFSVKSNLYPNYSPSGVLNVVRPLVVGVHGIFDGAHLFDHFLYTNTKTGNPDPTGSPDPRFVFKTVSYDRSLAGQILPTGTVLYGSEGGAAGLPGALNALATEANENQLGLAYNAPIVHDRLLWEIDKFRKQGLGVGSPLAAVQADVVAHSMGALIVRTSETLPTFLNANSFSRGQIHKLITVGTPHLGSQIPSEIIAQPAPSLVAQGLILSGRLALGPIVVFKNGKTCNGQPCSGGFFDMQGNGVNRVGLSPALNFLQDQTNAQVPTHQVAGKIDKTNFYGSDPAAGVSQWNTTHFAGQDSDAIVSLTSQLATMNIDTAKNGDVTPGLFHSSALSKAGGFFGLPIGLKGSYELDPGGKLIQRLIDLLQSPKEAGCTLGVFSTQATNCSLFVPLGPAR